MRFTTLDDWLRWQETLHPQVIELGLERVLAGMKVARPDPEFLANESNGFDMRGINRDTGCMVVVRPDQYVANVLPLDGYEELSAYFAGVLRVR